MCKEGYMVVILPFSTCSRLLHYGWYSVVKLLNE